MAEGTATYYLERNGFPILLPGLEEMLRVATMTEKRKHFNPVDYLVEYLYKNNPNKSESREDIAFDRIPFVEEEWKINPRPPLPLSATLTEDEARLILQAAYRGYKVIYCISCLLYKVRCREDVQLFRQWQKGFRKELNAIKTIQRHWREYKNNNQIQN